MVGGDNQSALGVLRDVLDAGQAQTKKYLEERAQNRPDD